MELLASPSHPQFLICLSSTQTNKRFAGIRVSGRWSLHILPTLLIIPDHQKWPSPESLLDLASVNEELGRLEILEQVVNQHQRDVEGRDEPSLTYESIQRQDGWSDAAERLKQQRAGLEARAAYLSRRPTSVMCLMDLTPELLVMILKCFEYTPTSEDTGRQGIIAEFPEENRRAIQALRLTCRRLNLLASPFLLPVVKLFLDRESLQFATNIGSRPHLAAGVQAIRVGLENRPAEIGADLDSFLVLKQSELERHAFTLRSELSQATILGRSAHAESVNQLEIARNNLHQANTLKDMTRLAMEELRRDQWNVWGIGPQGPFPNVQTGIVDAVHEEQLNLHKRFVKDAHAEFGRISWEQEELLRSGVFVGAVATLASHGTQPLSLEFWERPLYTPGRDLRNTRTPYRSPADLFRFLVAAPAWGNLDHPVRIDIIVNLPLAISNTGRTVNGFQLSCPPMVHQVPSIYSDDQLNVVWDRLSAASQKLKYLNFKKELKNSSPCDWSLVQSGWRGVCKYFGALFSGHCLEDVAFQGYAYQN
ncbi:unnamed protein product [Clonostachys rosea]|uniref:F-box domain-containing protein n=1 Tax=Bionectria ochroleuca TaxID=29856 RepID=A0ABY6U5Q3_BIOOC|nr:unnamed protein product [Clonostachys rosea]